MLRDEPQRGQIISFYSFKGGAGRSMALANVACLLAREQRSEKPILMIDWDLEAPGLHHYFEEHLPEDTPEDSPGGLIDLFLAIEQRVATCDHPLAADDDRITGIVEECRPDRFITRTRIDGLHLLAAGAFDGGYSSKVNAFDWEGLFHRAPGCFPVLGEYLAQRYSYVLIDSRTGHTDTGGICTALLPERLVAVFTPSRQSLLGLLDVVSNAVEYRRRSEDVRQLVVFPLPSRIENAEPDLREAWQFGKDSIEGYQGLFEGLFKRAYELAKCDLNEYFDEVQIQHLPRFAYGEPISVLVGGHSDRLSLTRSYEAFLDQLVRQPVPWVHDESRLSDLVEAVMEAANEPGATKRLRDQLATARNALGPKHPQALETKNRLLVASAVDESRKFVEKGNFVRGREVIAGLPTAPPYMSVVKSRLLTQIEEAEAASELNRQIDETVESSKALVGEGRFAEARKKIEAIPNRLAGVQELKRNLLEQIDDAELAARVQELVESAVEQAKALVNRRDITGAREAIRALPDSPGDLATLKKNLLGQISEAEESIKAAETENAEILKLLSGLNIDLSRIIAENNVDSHDPMHMNALLKAILGKLKT